MTVAPELVFVPKIQVFLNLKLLTICGRCLGLNNSGKSYLDWFIVVFLWCLYSVGCLVVIIHLDIVFDEHVSTILRVIEAIQLVVGLFLTTICSFNAFNAHSTIQLVLCHLNEIDIRMNSTVFRAINYRIRLLIVAAQLVLYIVTVIGLLLGHILAQHEIVDMPVLYYTIRFYPMVCIGVSVLLFANIIIDIRLRLMALNKLIEHHVVQGRHIPGRQLHLVCSIYELAFEICQQLNGTFGVCNLFQIGYCFISITSKIFFIFITLNDLQDATVQDISKWRGRPLK